MSPDEQKGLLGELQFLEDILIRHLDAFSAIESWAGPHGAPKDFEVGQVAIESKAHRAAATPFITISNENQLALTTKAVFLQVVDYTRTPKDSAAGETLTEVVNRLTSLLETQEPAVVDLWFSSLSATGYSDSHDYSNHRWLKQTPKYYSVSENFPKIVPEMLALGLSRVTYSLAINACAPFEVSKANIDEIIIGERDAL